MISFRIVFLLLCCFVVVYLLFLISTLPQKAAKLPNLLDLKGEEEWLIENANIPDLSVNIGKKRKDSQELASNCSTFPLLNRIHFSNVHWQVQETKNEKYFFYSAYLDARDQALANPSLNNLTVRVLAMTDARNMNATSSTLKSCQFWFENERTPTLGLITEFRLLWMGGLSAQHRYYPYLITCQLPTGWTKVPVSVSLASHDCEHATNNLNIVHRERVNQSVEERTPSKDIAICVKALDYPDGNATSRFIEWIEMSRILGADKIFIYEYFVHPDIKKMFNYYEAKGIIDVAQTTLPGNLPNHPQLRHLYIKDWGNMMNKYLTELLPYNDCLYRNLHEYKYLLIVDVDELIMPADKITWPALLDFLKKKDVKDNSTQANPFTTYCFRSFFFYDGMLKENEVSSIPTHFHMLRHVFKSTNKSLGESHKKCFHSTQFTTGVHNHYPIFCRNGCRRRFVTEDLAQLNHYKESERCEMEKYANKIQNCSEFFGQTEKDDKIWRYKDELMDRVETVLENIK